MALYRNSIFAHTPVTFSEASRIRRTSVHSLQTTSVFSGPGTLPVRCALNTVQAELHLDPVLPFQHKI